jgi:hypothetical protein
VGGSEKERRRPRARGCRGGSEFDHRARWARGTRHPAASSADRSIGDFAPRLALRRIHEPRSYRKPPAGRGRVGGRAMRRPTMGVAPAPRRALRGRIYTAATRRSPPHAACNPRTRAKGAAPPCTGKRRRRRARGVVAASYDVALACYYRDVSPS